MTIHIDYDREENKIELILASQSNMIRTLGSSPFYHTFQVQVLEGFIIQSSLVLWKDKSI